MYINTFKQPRQKIQLRLQVGRSGQDEDSTVFVKGRRQPLDRPYEPFWYLFLYFNQNNPVTNHQLNHHVEDSKGEGISLGDPLVALERGAVIVPHSGHHEEVLPIKYEEPLCLCSYHVSH